MDISIFMPTIRTHLLSRWYTTLVDSVGDYEFEVVLCGPFDLPKEVVSISNIRFIKSYAHPTKCAQLAAKLCRGRLLYHTVDDVQFEPKKISEAITALYEHGNIDSIVGMRYREGKDYKGTRLPDSYWKVGSAYGYLPINPNWNIFGHFLMNRSVFNLLGGFDCCFEYLNHAVHDLEIRAQKYGCNWVDYPDDICSADWMEGTTGDHAPIHYAQTTHDAPLFNEIWGSKPNRTIIDINNDQNYPDAWERRFPNGLPKTYEEMQS